MLLDASAMAFGPVTVTETRGEREGTVACRAWVPVLQLAVSFARASDGYQNSIILDSIIAQQSLTFRYLLNKLGRRHCHYNSTCEYLFYT